MKRHEARAALASGVMAVRWISVMASFAAAADGLSSSVNRERYRITPRSRTAAVRRNVRDWPSGARERARRASRLDFG